MFCSKCGTQLPDGSTFCSACGAQQTAPAAPVYAAPADPFAAPAARPAAPRPAGALKFRTPDIKNQKTLFYLIAAGLVLLAFIFSLTKVVKISAFGMSEGSTLGDCDRGGLLVVSILCALAAMAASALIALFEMPDNIKKICKFAAPIGAFFACLFFLIGYWSAKGEAMSVIGDYSSLVSIGLSFLGWVAVIFFLGAAGLTGYVLYTEEFQKPKAPQA